MDQARVRLATRLAELLGLAALALLVIGTMRENWRVMLWGIASIGGAMTMVTFAVVVCIGGKVIRIMLRQEAVAEAESIIRRGRG